MEKYCTKSKQKQIDSVLYRQDQIEKYGMQNTSSMQYQADFVS